MFKEMLTWHVLFPYFVKGLELSMRLLTFKSWKMKSEKNGHPDSTGTFISNKRWIS